MLDSCPRSTRLQTIHNDENLKAQYQMYAKNNTLPVMNKTMHVHPKWFQPLGGTEFEFRNQNNLPKQALWLWI
jgi:hypothetical protein